MNNITVLGRLTKDVQSGGEEDTLYAYGNIAVDSWDPNTRSKKSIFFFFNASGKSAKFLVDYCGKGDQVIFSGELAHGKQRDGDNHQNLVLKAFRVTKAASSPNKINAKPEPTENKFILRQAPKTIDDKIEEDLPF